MNRKNHALPWVCRSGFWPHSVPSSATFPVPRDVFTSISAPTLQGPILCLAHVTGQCPPLEVPLDTRTRLDTHVRRSSPMGLPPKPAQLHGPPPPGAPHMALGLFLSHSFVLFCHFSSFSRSFKMEVKCVLCTLILKKVCT